MIEKICTYCGVGKPLDNFHRSGKNPTGASPPRGGYGHERFCKPCRSHIRKPTLADERQQRATLDAAGLKICNVCRETKPRSDYKTRRASPDGLHYTCIVCANLRSARWNKAHPGAAREWYENNKEWKLQYWKQWRQSHPDRIKQSYRKWAQANKARINALIAKRNALKLNATPPWVDHLAIRAIYKEATRLTVATGIRHEVDHVIPLRHPRVCGLHIPVNLQILTSDENKRKSNQLPASERPCTEACL